MTSPSASTGRAGSPSAATCAVPPMLSGKPGGERHCSKAKTSGTTVRSDAERKAECQPYLQAPICQESRVHGRHRRHVAGRVVDMITSSTVHVRHPSELALEVIGLLKHRAVDNDLRTQLGKESHRRPAGHQACGCPAVSDGMVHLGVSSSRTSLWLKQRDVQLLVRCRTKEGRPVSVALAAQGKRSGSP